MLAKTTPTPPHYQNFLGRSTWSQTKKLTVATMLAVLTTLLQASGNYVPIIGLLISTFASFSVLLSVLLSPRYGMLTYILAILLLLLIDPVEFFVYPFTTGLLGVCLGLGLYIGLPALLIVLGSGAMLVIGICIVLYVIGFPVLGPWLVSFQLQGMAYLLLFATLYSLIWYFISRYLLAKLQRMYK